MRRTLRGKGDDLPTVLKSGKSPANPQLYRKKYAQEIDPNSFSDPNNHLIRILHRTVGNQSVQQLMSDKRNPMKNPFTSPTEMSEREADHMANVAVRHSFSDSVSSYTQAQPEYHGTDRYLPKQIRSHFERRFGCDFSNVQVHNDAEANAAAETIAAEAFTVGENIIFARGKYRPDSPYGYNLLAHELAHVVQNSASNENRTRIARRPDPSASEKPEETDSDNPRQSNTTSRQQQLRVDSAARREAAEQLSEAVKEAAKQTESAETGAASAQKIESTAKGIGDAVAVEQEGMSVAEEVTAESQNVADFSTRVREATKLSRSKWFDQRVAKVYYNQPNAGITIWTEIVWNELGLSGIPREATDRTLKRALRRLRIEQRVTQSLKKEFRSIARAAQKKEFAKTVSAFFAKALVTAPPGSTGQLTDLVWRDLLRCGRIEVLPESVQRTAASAWSQVRKKGISKGYSSWTGETAGEKITEGVPNDDRKAATAALQSHDTWIDTEGEMQSFLDTVAQNRGLRPSESSEDAIARSGMNERANLLLAVAETELIRKAMPDLWTKRLTPESWLRGRPNYVAVLEVPIWRYYTEYITSFSFLGRTIPKANGLHRDIVPLLADVEQTMLDEAGPSVNRVEDLGFRPRFYGFRFQPDDKKPGHGSISYHGTGRAFDMMARENPYFGGETMTLASIVSETWLHELTLSRSELTRLANEQRLLLDRRRELRSLLTETEDPAARSDLEEELAQIETELQSVHESTAATGLVTKVSRIHQKTVAAQKRLRANWQKYEPGMWSSNLDFSSLAASVDSVIESILQPSKESGAKSGPIADFDALTALVDQHLRQERAALKAANPKTKSINEERIEELTSLRELLVSPKRPKDRTRLIQTGKPIRPGVRELAKGGITNQPDWMIRAFTQHGWSWGGSWTSLKDSMHFDYMGSLDGVKK